MVPLIFGTIVVPLSQASWLLEALLDTRMLAMPLAAQLDDTG